MSLSDGPVKPGAENGEFDIDGFIGRSLFRRAFLPAIGCDRLSTPPRLVIRKLGLAQSSDDLRVF